MLERLQKVQNSAILIFQCHKQNHISPLLMSLHCLPIKACIQNKLSVICHSFFSGLSPIYLSIYSVYTQKRNLRSSDNTILCIHKLQTKTFGYLSCSLAAPSLEFFAFRTETFMCLFIIMSIIAKRHELRCSVRDMRLSKCSIITIYIY